MITSFLDLSPVIFQKLYTDGHYFQHNCQHEETCYTLNSLCRWYVAHFFFFFFLSVDSSAVSEQCSRDAQHHQRNPLCADPVSVKAGSCSIVFLRYGAWVCLSRDMTAAHQDIHASYQALQPVKGVAWHAGHKAWMCRRLVPLCKHAS